MYTINESAHTKKSLDTYRMHLVSLLSVHLWCYTEFCWSLSFSTAKPHLIINGISVWGVRQIDVRGYGVAENLSKLTLGTPAWVA